MSTDFLLIGLSISYSSIRFFSAACPMDADAASSSQPVQRNATYSAPILTIPSKKSATPAAPDTTNKVGQSIFYDCLDLSPTAEKQDDMKPERSDTEEDSKSIVLKSKSHRLNSQMKS